MTPATPIKGAAEQDRDIATDEMTEGDAAEFLLRQFLPKDADKPSEGEEDKTKKSAEPKEEAKDEEPADEDQPDDKSEDEAKGDEDEETETDESETVVKIKVGDEEHEVPVSKLTRLYGQEAALTKKSMEVAEQRKTVEKDLAVNTQATQALLNRAKARFEPYGKLDFNLLAAQVGKGELSNEDYQALRQGAQAAYEDVQFLEKHLNDFHVALTERRATEMRAQAKECLKVLSGPEDQGGIPGWNEKLYDDLRTFAV